MDVLDFFVRVLGDESPLDHPDDASIVGYYRTDRIVGENVILNLDARDDDCDLLEGFSPRMNEWWRGLCSDIENLVERNKDNDYYTEDGALNHILNHPDLSFAPDGKFLDPETIDLEEMDDANNENDRAAS